MLSILTDLLIGRAKRKPYFDLADYMHRFWLRQHNEAKSNWAARVHNIKRSDYDRALHDHPWLNVSVLLRGGYWEVSPGAYQEAIEANSIGAHPDLASLHLLIHELPGTDVTRLARKELAAAGVRWRGRGAIVYRKAKSLHRLVVPAGREAWSLFVMGPKVRDWGFAAPLGWVHNEQYTKELGRDA